MSLARIKRKDPITARFLNRQIDTVNQITDKLNGPRDPDEGLENTAETPQDESQDEIAAQTWQETSRTTSTVRIADPNDSAIYVDVDQIDTVTMDTPMGRITLRFNN